MDVAYVRLLRTPTSERHVLQRNQEDFAALDIHYLQNGTVQATLVIFEGSGVEEADVPELLNHIDEVLLPEVRLDDKTLTFTVVMGRVLGAYQSESEPPPAPATLA